jgi:hypothetical protein
MKSSKKGNASLVAAGSAAVPSVRGLSYNPLENSFSFSVADIPASDHVFYCTDYRIIQDGSQLHFILGNRSKLSKQNIFQLAIEIAFPIKRAIDFFYDGAWENKSLNGTATFVESLRKTVSDLDSTYSSSTGSRQRVSDLELHLDPSCYRMFSSNFATLSLADGQGMVEFFVGAPDLIVNIIHRNTVRPNDGIKSIVAVIMTPQTLLKMLEELQGILRPFASKEA